MELRKENHSYTYADYRTWDNGQRWEIIEGAPCLMSPAPTFAHQQLCGEVFGQLREYLKGKPCQAALAPLDVRFEDNDRTNTVVQPDVMVICDKTKIKKEGCVGAPDVVFEVLSPTTASRDMITKYSLYEKHGVREYWVIDPEEKTLVRFSLQDGQYQRSQLQRGRMESLAMPGFTLEAQELFASLDDIAKT
jgi:Uma2 family endonuclease